MDFLYDRHAIILSATSMAPVHEPEWPSEKLPESGAEAACGVATKAMPRPALTSSRPTQRLVPTCQPAQRALNYYIDIIY